MPTDGCYSLEEYIRSLVDELGRADPDALARMRRVVGDRSARITLDDESVEVRFEDDRLAVVPATARETDGVGETDRATVLDLLDGYVEAMDAILDGRLEVTGTAEDVHRIFVAIEILLDASARDPELQELARAFRADPCRAKRGKPARATRRTPWFPPRPQPAEETLLARLDLLPDGSGGPLDGERRGWNHRGDPGRGRTP